jgi:hypothetical protein
VSSIKKDCDVMIMVRHLVLKCLQFNILFRAKHIAGKRNVLADFLSRLQVEEFRKQAPHAQPFPCQIPEKFFTPFRPNILSYVQGFKWVQFCNLAFCITDLNVYCFLVHLCVLFSLLNFNFNLTWVVCFYHILSVKWGCHKYILFKE